MEILTPKDREALSKYPLYSQDGKQGEAVARDLAYIWKIDD